MLKKKSAVRFQNKLTAVRARGGGGGRREGGGLTEDQNKFT